MKYTIDKNYIFNKYDITQYLRYQYHQQYHDDISTVKLQKIMYFSFAYWCQWYMNDLSQSWLFDARYEAWINGMVDPDVYYFHTLAPIKPPRLNMVHQDSQLALHHILFIYKTFVDTSDFALIDMATDDTVWIDNYQPKCKKPVSAYSIYNKYKNEEED